MKICEFTKPELEHFREQCNFTNAEMALFDYRARDIPLEQCAENMNVSMGTVYRISQKVNRKIKRVEA